MPELPEVETVRRSLLACVQGLTIESVRVTLAKLLQNTSAEEFVQSIVGRKILDIERRGKYLMFRLSGCYTLVIHLRMTGQLRYSAPQEPMLPHTHIILSFTNGQELRYTDIRQFGFWFYASDEEILEVSRIQHLGVEPLGDEFSLEAFEQMLLGKKGNIKAFLLNQHHIAGIGNIYADEALFAAGLRPTRTLDTLNACEVSKLHKALRHVLEKGVSMRGTTFSDYVDGLGLSGSFQYELKVYGRKEKPCLICGSPIERTIVAGRGTQFCPNCQH